MEMEGRDEIVGEEVPEVHFKKQNNTLPLFGNKQTMNINHMIMTNILQSRYFKTDLYEMKTFHEVVDEIYYRVNHLEPWEKNSRKLAGQVGMCAGVRGVAAGGIVSTPFCLLYKLFTLKLTRKQVNVMLNHCDSPYIRGLGFMYIRYCQPPNDFLDWFTPYLTDEEEIDLKAGGGYVVTVGTMCRMMLTKMDWFGTMFPRISVNVQKEIQDKIKKLGADERAAKEDIVDVQSKVPTENDSSKRSHNDKKRSPENRSSPTEERRHSRDSHRRKHDRDRYRSRSRERKESSRSSRRRSTSRSPPRRHRSRSRDRHYRSRY